METALAGAISLIGAALATLILRAASYYFPERHHRPGAEKDDEED